MKIKACITSLRLRTLPLSLAGVCLGIFIAAAHTDLRPLTVVFLLLTTVCLQILSNLSNELGDTLLGTDSDERQGIHYSLQDGGMTIPEMKKLIATFAVLCCVFGLVMVWSAFGTVFAVAPCALLVLGAAAIWAAMRYTLGKNPYGYRGLGDIFVFIFFGLVSTCGAYYVCTQDIAIWPAFLPSCAIGCFSVGVLNINNIRDMKTDAATRVTMALRMGLRRARIYQTVLVVLGWVCLITSFALAPDMTWVNWLFLLILPVHAFNVYAIWTKKDSALDPMLPMLVMSTFALSLLAGIPLLF